jgi:hypothetical protein
LIRPVTIAPSGELWVQRRPAEPGPDRIDVFRDTGEYIGTLPIESPFPIAFLGADRFAAVEETDDGARYVAIYDVIR